MKQLAEHTCPIDTWFCSNDWLFQKTVLGWP